MKTGDVIKVRVRHEINLTSETIKARVYQIYPRFVVLDTGKYRFCAYISDIERNRRIIN